MPDPVTPQPAPAAPDPRDAQIAALQKEVQYFKDEVIPFVESASLIVTTISQDAGLKEGVKNAILRNGGQAPATPVAPATPAQPPVAPVAPVAPAPQPAADPRVDNMDAKARDDIIGRVEARLQLSGKTDAEKQAIRQAVNQRMQRYGQTILSVPVTALESILTDHYVMNELDGHPESARVTEILSAKNNPSILPAASAQAPNTDATALNAEQAKWSKKLGTDDNKVTSFLKEMQETGVATYKPKEPAPAASPAIPSGTPSGIPEATPGTPATPTA